MSRENMPTIVIVPPTVITSFRRMPPSLQSVPQRQASFSSRSDHSIGGSICRPRRQPLNHAVEAIGPGLRICVRAESRSNSESDIGRPYSAPTITAPPRRTRNPTTDTPRVSGSSQGRLWSIQWANALTRGISPTAISATIPPSSFAHSRPVFIAAGYSRSAAGCPAHALRLAGAALGPVHADAVIRRLPVPALLSFGAQVVAIHRQCARLPHHLLKIRDVTLPALVELGADFAVAFVDLGRPLLRRDARRLQ